MVWLQQFFFLFFSLLSLLASGFMSALPKIKCVMLSLYLYQFYPHSFNYYLFCFQCFLKLFFYSISSLNILFHLIFVSNLVLIICIAVIFIYFSILFICILLHLIFVSNLVLILFIAIFLIYFNFQFSPLLFYFILFLF